MEALKDCPYWHHFVMKIPFTEGQNLSACAPLCCQNLCCASRFCMGDRGPPPTDRIRGALHPHAKAYTKVAIPGLLPYLDDYIMSARDPRAHEAIC